LPGSPPLDCQPLSRYHAPDQSLRSLPLDSRASIAKAAGIIMLGNILSRLLGLVREQVIAAIFGARSATDAFVVASTVPTMVYDLLVSGAISAALIPVFSDYADGEDSAEFSRVVSAVLSMAVAALVLVMAVLLLLAPWLVDLLGAGFDQQGKGLVVYLVRLMLPSVLLMGAAGVLTATLYARRSFTLPAFSVAVYNLGIIMGGVLLAERLEVASLVIGVLIGAALQVVIQWPGLRGLRLRPTLNLSHPGVRSILRLYAPVALGLVISNIGVIIDRHLASQTGEGSMAAMRFATTLVQFPLGLVATATSFAVLPTLSRQAQDKGERGIIPDSASGAQSSYAATLRMGMKMILLLIVPAAVGLVVLREPIVQLLFQRGAFDRGATALTTLAFLGYSPGIAFAAVDQLLIFAFYARKDTRTPVAVGVMAIAVYLVVALTLVRPMGMLGLVLANAAQTISHAVVLLWLLNRAVGGVVDRELGIFVARVMVAAIAMGLACWAFVSAALPLGTTGPGVALLVMAGTALGSVIYVGGVVLLRVREAWETWAILVRRLRRGRPEAGNVGLQGR